MQDSLLIRNARIMAGNPASLIDGDLFIDGGKIRAIGSVPAVSAPVCEIDAGGKLVLPGLVDPHTHYIGDGPAGYRMLIARGVTTALDTIAMIGDAARKAITAMPVGLNCAAFYLLFPNRTLPNDNPTNDDIRQAIRASKEEGLYGLKIAGAHFPFTPEAMARIVSLAAENHVPLMIHAGSTRHCDDLAGMREMLDCCGNNPAILAHVNLYCNGASGKSQCEEADEAIEMLNDHPRIVSESTFSTVSCVGCRMVNGVPESLCMKVLLEQHGYEGTYKGLLASLEDGVFRASGLVGDYYDWLPPAEGVALAKEREGHVTVGVTAHDSRKNLRILQARRRASSEYLVTAFSTDGGVIPRNIVLEKGLEAVESGQFTLSEFVARASFGGASMLGLERQKGIITEGADGDVIIVDEMKKCPEYTVSGGSIVYMRGQFFERENTYIAAPPHTPGWLK